MSRRGKAEHLGAKYARVVGTVAHLELCHGRLGWDRSASGPVVISLGGQYPLRGLTAPARILLQPVNLYKQCRGGASWGGHRARPVPSNRKRCLPGPQQLSGGTPAETYALALHSETGLSASASEVMRQADSGWSVQLTAVHLPEPGSGNEQR